MALWIGVDDTDSLDGMCTTFLATELIRVLTQDHDLIGHPRLVRLNPNIPWKTRGNGALCIRVGEGRGTPRLVGQIGGRPILSFPRGNFRGDIELVAERVAEVVERWSSFGDTATNPGFVVLRTPTSPNLYWKGVRTILSKEEVLSAIDGRGIIREYKNGRGIIGSAAATAWRPRDRTYEILAYRERGRWGTPRDVDPSSVVEMDRLFRGTFNNYDYENRRVIIAPRSPCPVLLGIRGDNPSELVQALEALRSEPAERWLIFQTNQGTDDHVGPSSASEPMTTIRLQGIVSSPPRNLPGGHVVFGVGGTDVAVYEPSKQFRHVARQLVVGDRVEVIGSVRETPHTINAEKIRVASLIPLSRKTANPRCQLCHKSAKSLGRGAGFRCVRCGRRFAASEATWQRVERSITTGWFEPPVGSRRHLSRPLKRSLRHMGA